MIFHFLRRQILPISCENAWEFFSNPKNLPLITPPHLNFIITSTFLPEKMYAGQIITYRVCPLFRIPVTWVTEITHVDQPFYFVDEQRFGPYRFWHHQHHFKSVTGGVEMIDLIHYQLPFGLLGRFINRFKVCDDLNAIFNFREKKLIERFGSL
jgi:ligand-binding SRPBCC domain-containing protein